MGHLIPYRIDTTPGQLHVDIDGEDVTDRLAGFDLHGGPDELAVLVLHHRSGAGRIEGEAIIQVVDHDVSPVELIRGFLDAVDTAALEQRMLEVSDWSTSTGGACIAVLKELLG